MAITSIEGERLVGSHCAGDPSAFPTIVKAHYPALLARARHRLHDPHLAEDAVQEALLRAYRSLPRFGGYGEFHLTAWLYRILENVCIDEANRRRRALAVVERLASQPEELAPDAASTARLPDPQVTAAMAGLPPAYRNALIQREVEGLSYADMAAVAGISEDNARARVSRARSALRRLIAPVLTAVAWIAGTSRRGERVLLDGANHAAASTSASAASAAVAPAVAPVSVHIPAATQLISQVTAVVPESQVASAIKVATAAVIAVALPVGGVTAANRTPPKPAPPAIEVMQSASDPGDEKAAAEGTEAEDAPAEEALVEEEVASAIAADLPAEEPAADTTGTTESTEEPSTEGAPTGEEPVSGPSGDAEPVDEEAAPPAESAVVIDGATVGRRALDDGRYEFSGPVGFTTAAGDVEGRLSITCAIPGEGDDPDGEYRVAGSILTKGEHSGRIRLAGAMEAWSVDEDGVTTYVFSGRYTTDDSDKLGIAEAGTFTASFSDSWQAGLVIRLVPNGSTATRS